MLHTEVAPVSHVDRTKQSKALTRSLFVLLLAAALVGCGGDDDSSGNGTDGSGGSTGNGSGGGSSVEGDVPAGADFSFDLAEAVEDSVTSEGASRNTRPDQTRINFTGVSDGGENFSLLFTLEATEGETGEVATTNVAQMTHGAVTYRTGAGLSVHLEAYSNGRLAGTLEGEFAEKKERSSDEYSEISPPAQIEGAFDFEYDQ